MGFCTNCGKPLDEGINFCGHCGAPAKKHAGAAISGVQYPAPPQPHSQPPEPSPASRLDQFLSAFTKETGMTFGTGAELLSKGVLYSAETDGRGHNVMAVMTPKRYVRAPGLDEYLVRELRMERDGETGLCAANSIVVLQKFVVGFVNAFNAVYPEVGEPPRALVGRGEDSPMILVTPMVDCYIQGYAWHKPQPPVQQDAYGVPVGEDTSKWGPISRAALRNMKAGKEGPADEPGHPPPPPSGGQAGSFCPSCGRQLRHGSKFCPGCGRDLRGGPDQASRRGAAAVSSAAQGAQKRLDSAKDEVRNLKGAVMKKQGFFGRLVQGTPEQQAERAKNREYDKKVLRFNAKYLGGHPGYPVKDNYWVTLSLDDNVGALVIGKADVLYDSKDVLHEEIPYGNITGIGNEKHESRATVGAMSPVGFGYVGIAGNSRWAKRNLYTYVTYRDGRGFSYTLQFEFDNPETNQVELYKRIPR